jgi:hypothetical protein
MNSESASGSRSKASLNTLDDRYNNYNNNNYSSINSESLSNLIKSQPDDKIEKSEKISINSLKKIKTIKLSKEKIVDNIKFKDNNLKEKESKEFLENKNDILNIRKDLFGNVIKKGSKKHIVTFLDYKKSQSGNLIAYIEIESYKKYNKEATMRNYYDEVNCQCSCILF